jgi:hypothetical protein
MPSTNQQDTPSSYESPIEAIAYKWPEDKLLDIKPMTEDSALEYWNCVNRADRSDAVIQHYRECLQRFNNP